MNPVLIQIGSFTLRWYGMMIALAVVAGVCLAGKEGARKGFDPKEIKDFALFVILGGLIGSRIYYALFSDVTYFLARPLRLFAFWEGGLAIHGAILGGLLVTIYYTMKKKISFWKWADTLAPSLILGQAIGRIGCFFNGDAHGYPTTLPWGLVYSKDSPAGQMFPNLPLHPTQLYELGFNLVIFLTLWKLRKRHYFDGFLFLLYILLYSSARIFVELFRADRLTFFGDLSAAQTIGVVGIILSTGLLLIFNRKELRS
ncbi:MAG: prolipoprotein diacylglyceryl transferase [Proteobacteria bacterium]|nr:prolipoprotein diacylglyceryl transferase [Pseudomonadota bacterium]